MKLSKGYCQALIDTNENIDSDLDVTAHVYYIDLADSYEVAINWATGYDNHIKEEARDFKEFKINKLKDFGFELANLLEELESVKYDSDYDSRQAEIEFREEMKFESNRGN